MIAISDRLYAAFVGPNWRQHYLNAFSRIEESDGHPFRSWNSAAALVPYWFVYRGLSFWSLIFVLASLVLYAVFASFFALFPWMHSRLFLLPFVPAYLCTCVIQGVSADVLVRQKALREIRKVRRTASDEAAAIRTLSSMAPRGPEGGLTMHAIMMLVGLPVWAIVILTGTRILTPRYNQPQSVYVALMRASLRDMSVLQETFLIESSRYSDDPSELGYYPPNGVSVTLSAWADSGWSATMTHGMVAWPCNIFVGRVPPPVATGNEGMPSCEAPPGPAANQ